MGSESIKKNIFFILVLVLVSSTISLLRTPTLVGEWERQHIFRNFLKDKGSPIILHSVRRANTAAYTDKFGYGLLNISRRVVDTFNLTNNLRSIRLTTIFYGVLGIILFYIFVTRWWGHDIGFLSALLLSTNYNYLYFQNNLQPTITTFVCIFFALERFQFYLDKEKEDKFTVIARILLGFAFSLLALQYALGRLVYVFLVFCLFIDIFYDLKKLEFRTRLEMRNSFFLKLQILLAYIVFLFFYYSENVIRVFHPYFLNPPTSEHILNYSDGIKTTILWILFGIKIFIKTYFLGIPEGTSLKELIPINVIYTSAPSLLMPKLASLFSLVGFYVLFIKRKSYPFLFIIGLFCLLFFVPTLSSNLLDYSHVGLMIFRSIYILIPIIIIILLGMEEVRAFIKTKFSLDLKYLTYFMVLSICTWQTYNYFSEYVRADKHLNTFKFNPKTKDVDNLKVDTTIKQWDACQKGEHAKIEIYSYALSKAIGELAKANVSFKKTRLHIHLPHQEYYPKRFHKWYPWLGIGADHKKKQRPSIIKTFLPIYLAEMGVKTTYLNEEKGRFTDRRSGADLIITTNEKEYLEVKKSGSILITF
jgi:hypothetical protein